ncbi:MAG: hypothetical protein Q7J10_02810 [Methanosarcinaceae archaeon]|nr:hypothetical protein [Methanosarcinaceae archaeon]
MPKPIHFVLIAVSLFAVVITAVPQTLSLYTGQHDFVNGTNVDCAKCHNNIHTEMLASNASVLNAHQSAALNINYTTYLAVGGIDYDPNVGNITTNLDGDSSGSNDTWEWNSPTQMWIRDSDSKSYRMVLDADGNNVVENEELCRLCHQTTPITDSGHAATRRFCDDDRCHGNSNYNYTDPELFTNDVTDKVSIGKALSSATVHDMFYQNASTQATSRIIGEIPAFGYTPGGTVDSSVSKSYMACVGCHSESNATLQTTEMHYLHGDASASRQRYSYINGTIAIG